MLNIQLKAAGMTKVRLARNLGITTSAISKWNDVAPKYVYAYLEQYIENRELKQGKEWMRRFLGCDVKKIATEGSSVRKTKNE